MPKINNPESKARIIKMKKHLEEKLSHIFDMNNFDSYAEYIDEITIKKMISINPESNKDNIIDYFKNNNGTDKKSFNK